MFAFRRYRPGLIPGILLLAACSGGGETDTTAPAVVAVSPVANAVDVSVGSPITVTFSEPVRADSIDAGSFRVRENGNPLSGSFSVSGNVVQFRSATALATAADYAIELTTGIRDRAGNPLARNLAWTFRTAAQATVEIRWSASRAAAVNAAGGGYRIYHDTRANFVPVPGVNETDVPWPGSGQTPDHATVVLPAGTWYFKVVAYSALAGGQTSLPSAQTTVTIR